MLLEKGLTQLLGLQHPVLFRAGAALSAASDRCATSAMAVRRLHAAGIEVILDVVYNHTCEGSEMGPTLSWRGLDNASYYRLAETTALLHQRHRHRQHAQLSPSARAADGDGFAALLGAKRSTSTASASISGSTLGREAYGFDPGCRLLRRHAPGPGAVAAEADLRALGCRARAAISSAIIPPGFAEWNDRYRDGVRRYWRGDRGMRPELAARLSGSGDLFDPRTTTALGHRSTTSPRHDGFTLHDLVSYEAQAQRGQWRGQSRRHSRKLLHATGAPKARPTIRRSTPIASG